MAAGDVQLRLMQRSDYAAAVTLWQQSPGVQLRDADSEPAITRYLARNPGSSFVAEVNQKLVGTVLCGHDGRRGFLHHLAVDDAHRRKGIATLLVDAALQALREQEIFKTHILVLSGNGDAVTFWQTCRFGQRDDVILMSYTSPGTSNA
jgi:ribosomal protein S18 acetylase RimI-like enzyme